MLYKPKRPPCNEQYAHLGLRLCEVWSGHKKERQILFKQRIKLVFYFYIWFVLRIALLYMVHVVTNYFLFWVGCIFVNKSLLWVTAFVNTAPALGQSRWCSHTGHQARGGHRQHWGTPALLPTWSCRSKWSLESEALGLIRLNGDQQ